MEGEKGVWTKSLAIILILSALGSVNSVLVGYAGRLLTMVTTFSFVVPQMLAGLHVFWLVLTALLVRTRGSATIAGALKGLIEAMLFSHLGVFSFLISVLQGVIVDLVFAILKKNSSLVVYVGSGLSSASHLIIVQIFISPAPTLLVYAISYLVAFISGLLFGGYLSTKVFKVVPDIMKTTTVQS